jgi:lipopolysaccharide assembly protein A
MSTDPQIPAEPTRLPESATPGAAPADMAPGNASVPLPHHEIRRTRTSGVWIAVACFAVVLLLLLIFILQNSHTVDVSYFGAHGHLPLGIALLLSAVFGVLLVVLPGTARIIQLRIAARRHRRADARHVAAMAHRADAPGPPAASA